MAVAAEAFMYEHPYRLVDDIPEAYDARRAVRLDAEALLDNRRADVAQGEAVLLPPVDALSTAHKVLEAETMYGRGSAEHVQRYKGLVLDCHRLVAEWYRKKTSEYFPPVRHVFDIETEEFFSHGLSVRQMTENALMPISGDPEEESRRINEHVEDATPHIVRGLGCIALGVEKIRTVSECTDKAIADYAWDVKHKRPHRGYGGYVPEIKKVMIRDISLDTDILDRYEEQVGLPGRFITHYIIQKALERGGAEVSDMDKTQLHGAQILARDDLLDFVRVLDTVASEEWCTNIFMGEVVAADHAKNYATFRQHALKRQEGLKDMAETVAMFVLDLAEDNVDRRRAPAMVEKFVKIQLLELGKQSTIIAEQMFDAKTAQRLQQVAHFQAIGQNEQAFMLMQQVIEQAPGGGFCGAGSCGLEAIDLSSESGQDLAKKVGAKAGDTVLRDTERTCRCGKKGIIYAFNSKEVKKYCESCSARESKVSIASK